MFILPLLKGFRRMLGAPPPAPVKGTSIVAVFKEAYEPKRILFWASNPLMRDGSASGAGFGEIG